MRQSVILAMVVGVALGALEWRVVQGNVGAEWNGYGAIPGMLRRDNDAPMRYRVLAGWVLGILARVFGCRIEVWHYQALKAGLLTAALMVAEQLFGTVGMLVVAVLVATTFEFDYWDCYAELLGVGLVLLGGQAGDWRLAAAGAVVWGLSRETAVVAPVLGLLAGGWTTGVAAMAGPMALGMVRVVQGRAHLYCARWTLRVYNVRDLRVARGRWDAGPWLSVGWTVAAGVAALWLGVMDSGVMGRTAGVGLVWIVAGWLMGRARETRVFLPCALWMAAAIGAR